ncbi:MAG: glycosyltransferase [Kouleothrix sp.]
MHRNYPEVQVIALPHNRGLAAAVNADANWGEYVVLLNNDTEAHPRWLEQLVGALERYPEYTLPPQQALCCSISASIFIRRAISTVPMVRW